MSFTENKNLRIGLVIMASGLSKRFGRNKLMEPLGEKPLIQWLLDKSNDYFSKRIVVTRSRDVEDFCKLYGIECIYHELPYRSDTVRLGLEALKDSVDYCFFAPADQPLITKESLEALEKAARDYPDKIVRPSFSDTVGAPMGFPSSYFSQLEKLPEGKGGNWVAKGDPNNVHLVSVQFEYELLDIDTQSDLENVKKLIHKQL